MKLYLSPGACSMASHIVLHELGLKHTIERVDLRAKPAVLAGTTTPLTSVNPKGSVPPLKLDDGQVLTEGAVILQYLADQKPDAGLMPATGSMDRYRAMEWLNFVGSDIHKGLSPFWNPNLPEDMKPTLKQNLDRRLQFAEKHLANNQYLMGDKFTVADAYLFVVFSWMSFLKLDTAPYPNLNAYRERIATRPSVVKTQAAEA